ncbi:MAG: hypothetical protein WC054_00275 [Candidatus Nanopelagicales bacterium]
MHVAEFLSLFWPGGRGMREPRVFWPGDDLPKGVVVMGRDGSVGKVEYDGMKVQESQPDPVVEVLLPRFDYVVTKAHGRKWAREEISANPSNLS